MEIKEKIQKFYQQKNIIVDDYTVKAIMQNKERTIELIRLYEEIIKNIKMEVNL